MSGYGETTVMCKLRFLFFTICSVGQQTPKVAGCRVRYCLWV